MKFSEAIESARLRVKTMLRERRERAEEKRAEREAAAIRDQHHHSRFWLLNVPALATVCAAIVEWYWAVLFCIEATGQLGMDWRTSLGSDTAAEGAWHFLFDIQSVWVLIGLVLATMPIVMLSMIWLPVQFAMRGAGRWRRGSLIAVGLLANVLVIVSGTVVMNYNRQDQVREALVVEQTADANRAMLTSSVEDLRGELDTLMNHRSTYVATAASVGAVAYERDYVTQARASNDPRLPLLERALGSARRADELRAQIRAARAQVAQAAPAAASQANVEDNVGRELNTFAQYVEVWRPPFVAFICTLIGIFGAWWTLAMLERLNPKDVLRSGWADDAHRIEDLRAEEPVPPKPMKPARRKFTEADTGEEIEQTLVPAHYRTLRKGQRTRVEIKPDIPPDERGVDVDGGARIGVPKQAAANTIGGAFDVGSVVTETNINAEQKLGDADNHDSDNHDEPQDSEKLHEEPPIPDLDYASDEEELDAAIADDASVLTPDADPQDDASEQDDQQNEHVDLPDGEGVMFESEDPEQDERVIPRAALEPAK